MSKKNILNDLNSIDFKNIPSFKRKIQSLDSSNDILYNVNLIIFQSSQINHKVRLSLLKKNEKLSLKYNLYFCRAHALTLIIKVCRELGIKEKLITDSHKSIELWKNILNEPLAINGLIFSYTDLGLIFSDYDLHMLAIKYLDKARSLITECKDQYNVSTKLYVAYAIVYNKSKNYKKANASNNRAIKIAEDKNDLMTLIPILINTSDDLIKRKKYKEAEIKILKALDISIENNDEIYRPYIYHCLGLAYLENKSYEKSKKCLDKSLDSFKKMSLMKMIPIVLYSIAEIFYREKKYNKSIVIFKDALKKNSKINDYDLDILLLNRLLAIYKKNKDSEYVLSFTNQLNQVLIRQMKYKQKIFLDTTQNALKYLSQEFDTSFKKNEDLKLKFNFESQKRKLTTQALISVSEREFLKNIIDKLHVQKLDNEKIIGICKQRLQLTKDWNVFMKLFNDIHPKFNQFIIKKCPLITESELRICNLIKMSFTTQEITEMLSISKRGVEQHRYRIRKKLAIEADLTIFLQSI